MKIKKTKIAILLIILGLFSLAKSSSAITLDCGIACDSHNPANNPTWHFMQATGAEKIAVIGNVAGSGLLYISVLTVLVGLVLSFFKSKKTVGLSILKIALWLFGMSVYIFLVTYLVDIITMHSAHTVCIDYCNEAHLPNAWYTKFLFFL